MAEEPRSNRDPAPQAPDTGLESRQEIRGQHVGDRAIRIRRHQDFANVGTGVIRPRRGVGEGKGLGARLARLLFGNPIESSAEGNERVGVIRGLAIFASDNISSSAYATEEIMRVLVVAGVGSLALTMPITLVVIVVLGIVILSDRIVIETYPDGGGSYRVAQQNLGMIPSLLAAAALLTDYTLTVAVSVSAGVAAITSIFPPLADNRVVIALCIIAMITVVNLRGLREAGTAFAIPVYLYLVSILGLIAWGLFSFVTGSLPHYATPTEWLELHPAEPLALIVILRAFASGSVALTGAEAVSNGTPSFQPPEVKNAQFTVALMGVMFAVIFGGLSFIAGQMGIVPDPHEVETVLSQITRTLTGTGPLYLLVQVSTAILLVIAGNTAFNAFPRLASLLAKDQYLPRQFSFRGDRLAFTGGILVLAVFAALLVLIYNASVTGLIPLYTVGVFIAFTLSQAGLIRRLWPRRSERGTMLRLARVGVGCLATGLVAIIVAVSKFVLGAWMVLLALPILIALMWGVHRHYQRISRQSEPETPIDPTAVRVRAVVPIANLEMPARQAVAYAEALVGADATAAVHITDDEEEGRTLRRQWGEAGFTTPLIIIDSPYRSLIGPMIAYVQAVRDMHPNDTINVILPEYIPRHWWENLIHNKTAFRLRSSLLYTPGVVVSTVPYHMSDSQDHRDGGAA